MRWPWSKRSEWAHHPSLTLVDVIRAEWWAYATSVLFNRRDPTDRSSVPWPTPYRGPYR